MARLEAGDYLGGWVAWLVVGLGERMGSSGGWLLVGDAMACLEGRALA